MDLEKFKGHIYPDLLLSILIDTFSEFKIWLDSAAIAPSNKRSFWESISFLQPDKRRADITATKALSKKLGLEIEELNRLLHQEEVVQVSTVDNAKISQKSQTGGGIGATSGNVNLGVEAKSIRAASRFSEKMTAYQSEKHKILQRNVIRYQNIFKEIRSISNSEVFLILDDLYHIPKQDQPDVIDYFHKIAKGGNFWIKIGTVRHRTSHYRNGNPPIGMKLSDDIDSIDLDVTLEKYSTTKAFLFKVLTEFALDSGADLSSILTDGAKDRLVLVSGGVARDFLSLFRKAIEEARERITSGKLSRGGRVTSEDTNRASGKYYDDKLQELDRDTNDEDRESIEEFIESVRQFCFDRSKTNCILIEKDRSNDLNNVVGELVDLKILHQVRTGISVSKEPGKRFDAYMLDYSFYTGDRTKRNFTVIDFWKANASDEILRRVGLIYDRAA